MVALVVLLALTGGSSRVDAPLLFLLRPLLVLGAAALIPLPAGDLARSTYVPLILLGLLAVVIAAQLVPLPPTIWTALPERAGDMQVSIWLKQPVPWRPLSIVPVLTLNSLFALLPAAAALIGVSRLDRVDTRLLVSVLLACGIASVLLGIIQIGSGAAYLYSHRSEGLPDGLFANRNHQAAFLAGLLPLLAAWAVCQKVDGLSSARRVAAGIVAVILVVTVLITGSRTGLLLTILNLMVASAVVLRGAPSQSRSRMQASVIGILATLAVLIGSAVLLGRGGGIERFEGLDPGAELRVQSYPVVGRLVHTYLPWGSGFGTFDPLYRRYEPDRLLNPTYLNNAHNDLMELALTGGVPALLLLAALVVWLAWRALLAAWGWWRAPSRWSAVLPLAGTMTAVTWLIASLPDYPLRTPLAGAFFAISSCLMATGEHREKTRRL